jgi:hypothetical protein
MSYRDFQKLVVDSFVRQTLLPEKDSPLTGGATLETIAKTCGVLRERIRQNEARALYKLRHPSRSRHLRPFLEVDHAPPFAARGCRRIKTTQQKQKARFWSNTATGLLEW